MVDFARPREAAAGETMPRAATPQRVADAHKLQGLCGTMGFVALAAAAAAIERAAEAGQETMPLVLQVHELTDATRAALIAAGMRGISTPDPTQAD